METSACHNQKHNHVRSGFSYRRMWVVLIINFLFLIVEVIGGILANSLALLADAGHMTTDVGALVLALLMAHISKRPPTPERTFGLLRAEVLGAFINGAALVIIVGLIFREAWKRLGHADHVDAPFMLIVAFAGLSANLASTIILAKGRRENINVHGAFLHMLSDTMGSVGAIVAGVVIWLTGWYPIDFIAGFVIGILILWSSWGFIRETMNILLEATPEHIDFMEVKNALESIDYIEEVHDLHIWTITSGMPALSAHLTLTPGCSETAHWQESIGKATRVLKERFGIEHTTLQAEGDNSTCDKTCGVEEGERKRY